MNEDGRNKHKLKYTDNLREADIMLDMGGNWICSLAHNADVSVRVIGCKHVPGKTGKIGRGLVEVIAPSMSGSEIKKMILNQPGVCCVNLSDAGEGRFIGTVDNSKCAACDVLADSGCYLISAFPVPGGKVLWKLIADGAGSLQTLIKRLDGIGCRTEIIRNVCLEKKALLTARQELALRLALELGFFDVPRRITTEELARKMGISKSTLDVIIRRAERKIISEHFLGSAIVK